MDLISRQAAIDELDKGAWGAEWDKALAQAMIESLPSAQPELKKGKWIDEGQYADGHSEHAYYCSQCEEHYIGWIGEFNFCPNCGSHNGGEQNE